MIYKKIGKRCCDVLFSTISLPLLVFVLIPAAIAIKVEDHGPVFYNAPRLGKNGKIFKMYKLRSMKVNAPDVRLEDGSTYNGKDDPRVTKVGMFIRKVSIDEIPQILNVIKGEMSFIGPRPDLPEHLQQYQGNEIRKLEIKPGLSGYSQAYYRNSIQWKERIKNDIYYIDHLTFLLDLKIFLKTIQIIFKKENVFIDNAQRVEQCE